MNIAAPPVLCLLLFISHVGAFLDSRTYCDTNAAYQRLYLRFTSNTECASFQEVGKILSEEMDKDHNFMRHPHSCLRSLITKLGEHFRNTHTIPDQCTCSGHHTLWPYTDIGVCHHQQDPTFLKLRDDVYRVGGRHPVCTTHHTMWRDMSRIMHDGNKEPCQYTFVRQMAGSFKQHGSGCTCTRAVETTTPTIPTTTALVLKNYTCDKLRLITSIARTETVSNSDASHCPQSTDNPSDALILDMCTSGQLSGWTRGLKVIDNCANIAPYTPIGTFSGGTYSTAGSVAAVFIQCEIDGFEIAYQTCGSAPVLGHTTRTGTGIFDADSYYTIN